MRAQSIYVRMGAHFKIIFILGFATFDRQELELDWGIEEYSRSRQVATYPGIGSEDEAEARLICVIVDSQFG